MSVLLSLFFFLKHCLIIIVFEVIKLQCSLAQRFRVAYSWDWLNVLNMWAHGFHLVWKFLGFQDLFLFKYFFFLLSSESLHKCQAFTVILGVTFVVMGDTPSVGVSFCCFCYYVFELILFFSIKCVDPLMRDTQHAISIIQGRFSFVHRSFRLF